MELVSASRSKFDNANLNGVGFYKARLNEATFINADMTDVSLPGALLYRANLTGAKLGGVITTDPETGFYLYQNGISNAAICPDGRTSDVFINCGIF
jgi:uncharacterized protein YjbI with pentapeptide repeats